MPYLINAQFEQKAQLHTPESSNCYCKVRKHITRAPGMGRALNPASYYQSQRIFLVQHSRDAHLIFITPIFPMFLILLKNIYTAHYTPYFCFN